MTERKLSRRHMLTGGAVPAGLLATPGKDDPVAVEAQAVGIKARCQKTFGM